MKMTKLNNLDAKNQEAPEIANTDWPILNEVNRTPFLIKTKKSTLDIEKSSQAIHSNSEKEDEVIANNNKVEENVMKVEPTTILNENKVTNSNQVEQPAVTLNKPVPAFKAKPEVKDNVTFLKQIGVGLMHLFIVNATLLLKPMNFVAQNFVKIAMAFIHMGMPLLMTYWLVHKVDFISIQLNKETTPMYLVYCAMFYIACAFIWIVGQIVAKGVFVSFKRSMYEVAKVGQEKI